MHALGLLWPGGVLSLCATKAYLHIAVGSAVTNHVIYNEDKSVCSDPARTCKHTWTFVWWVNMYLVGHGTS